MRNIEVNTFTCHTHLQRLTRVPSNRFVWTGPGRVVTFVTRPTFALLYRLHRHNRFHLDGRLGTVLY